MNLIMTAATRKRAGEGIKAEPSYVLSCLTSISRIMNDEKLTDVYLPLLGSGHGDRDIARLGFRGRPGERDQQDGQQRGEQEDHGNQWRSATAGRVFWRVFWRG